MKVRGGEFKVRVAAESELHLIPGPSPEGEGCLFEEYLELKRELCGE